jgi:hypothetical protein
LRLAGRILAWVAGIPVALLGVLYVVLLITPIPLPFLGTQVRNVIAGSMPEGSGIELGEMALALENYTWPVIQFTPVVYTDKISGARITMEGLHVGFSPIRALWGQPGATVTVVKPYIQVNQDLFGPRLVSFDIVPGENGAPPTVRILEGEDAFPEVDLSPEGVDLTGEMPPSALQMRSDNDWLIYNLEGAEKGIASIVEQANNGSFSRLIIKDARLDMNDALYGLFRTFNDINIDIAPNPSGTVVEGKFTTDFGGTVMNGILERVLEDDGKTSRLKASVTNLDLASFMPMVDDKDGMMALVGPTAVSIDVGFEAATGKIKDGLFHLDLTGTDIRVEDDYFPVATSIMEIRWEPHIGQFTMADTQMTIGKSTGYMSGVFKLGIDELYGPTVSMSVQARDVSIWSENGAPESPFAKIAFSGWSAPLYGATGIDQFVAEKADGAQIASTGRVDMVKRGMGFDMTIAGDGVTADDLKRLWPYFVSPDARDWFVKNIVGGKLKRSSMRYSFPVGTLPAEGEEPKALPKNAISIDIVGEGVKIVPVEGMSPIEIEGETRFEMRDASLTAAADGATIETEGGRIAIANFGFKMTSETPGETIMELSGDLSSGIPALVALAKEQQPDLLKNDDLPIDVASLAGKLSLSLVSTIVMEDGAEEPKSLDYAVNGIVQDFGSTEKLDNHEIANGQLSFVASQQGFDLRGQAEVDGLPAEIVLQGKLEENAPPPTMYLSAELDAADFKKMGFDISEFVTGKIKFVAKPMPDTSIQIAVDVTDASVNIKDLGISKAAGVKGSLQAAVHQKGDTTDVTHIDIGFGDVKLQGSLGFDTKKNELLSAEFSSFAMSPGDAAQISVTPVRGGIEVRVRGDQLDLKPMLKRFFDLAGESTGGPQATALGDTTVVLDIELQRALGFYATTAYNVDIDLAMRGDKIQRASLSAQFGDSRALSVTTNQTPEGRTMTMAFNDLGTVLRLLNVYPNLQGGQGTLVMQTIDAQNVDNGQFILRNFAIVDEANLQQMVGNAAQSRGARGDMVFKSGQLDFVRRKDRIEITEAVLAGDSVGGTARGTIYTDARQYDISGTYVPLFGLNSVFQKLLGPLGGREGEGLLGVTFAIRGPLDKPDFQINPISALAPGAFRRMFEFRQKEIPDAQ